METQTEFAGMPAPSSLARLLNRHDLLDLTASARIGYVIASATGSRRRMTASPALEMARTFIGARFTHDDRHTLAALACLPVRNSVVPAEILPTEKEVAARVRWLARQTRRIFLRIARELRRLERKPNDR